MEALRTYFLSVTAAAILCAILKGLLQQSGTSAQLVKLVSGIFLALIAIQPLSRFEMQVFSDIGIDYSIQGEAFARDGENIAADGLKQLIKSNTEAYILDKARSLGATLTVEVTVTDGRIPVPETVYLMGNVSPYIKTQLTSLLIEGLGIAKEDLIWTG